MATTFPTLTFNIPTAIANNGFQLAIYGQHPVSKAWMYWSQSKNAYVNFNTSYSGYESDLLNDATPNKGKYKKAVSYAVTLSSSQLINSGVVVMFVGGSHGISVAAGIPAVPSPGTNPNDLYSLFELSFINNNSGVPTLDIDISNVDQVGFTYTVVSSSAPFPLATVGSTVTQSDLFARFNKLFPAGTAFNECLLYGQENIGGTSKQMRLLAPQDVLADINPPIAPSFLQPNGVPTNPEAFADYSYFYGVTEVSATGGETAMSHGAFGGFLVTSANVPTASQINVGWQYNNAPIQFTPVNPNTTSINIYRASIPPISSNVPSPPKTGWGLLTSSTVADWNKQSPLYYVDTNLSTGTRQPPATSYGFSGLSKWFDGPLSQFFVNYMSNTFALYQSNQNGGTNGTLWTGNVITVTPQPGNAITSIQYVDQNGNSNSIATTWQWGDGTQSYLVLQLVGNAYDPTNYSNTNLAGQSGLSQGEYQGAVVNIYFPYFTGNTGLTSITLSNGTVYNLPTAPSWMNNAVNGPSQMVFGCAGVFATPNDPDATAQSGTYPVLAVDALTNLQNVIVSALNRGVATGYNLGLNPMQYSCQLCFSQSPSAVASRKGLAKGTYTYYLSGILNDGTETALCPPQTIVLKKVAVVALNWLAQSSAWYKKINVYRQTGSASPVLIGTVDNTTAPPPTAFADKNAPLPPAPTNGAPFLFYPSWNNSKAAGFVNSNLFSAFLHQNLNADPVNGISTNGLVYGYPFDDQGNFSTNINYGTALPATVTFNISDLG